MYTKQRLKKIFTFGIVIGVLLSITGLIVAICSGTNHVAESIVFGADYYTDSYRAMAASANNARLVGIALGLAMIAAGIIVCLVYSTKIVKLDDISENHTTLGNVGASSNNSLE